MKKGISAAAGLLGILVSLPIWFWLLHYILVSIHASDLALFLFWVYVPVSLLVTVIGKLVTAG